MLTRVSAAELAEIPVAELATCAAPARWHEALISLGVHRRADAWLVSAPHDVAAALSCTALAVTPPLDPSGAAGELLARMARFANGEAHTLRRALVMRLMPPLPAVVTATGNLASEYLLRRTTTFDIMPMARTLPAEVLAKAMGLAEADAKMAARLTGQLCAAVSPTLAVVAESRADADRAAGELCAVLHRCGLHDDEEIAAAVSILFQARDATAALIGTAVLAAPFGRPVGHARRSRRAAASGPASWRQANSPAQRVDHVLRNEAPVQCTRRTAIADVLVGDTAVPAGSAVWIFVAAAEQGSGMPATFGAGPHRCPGASLATAIARQVVTVLDAEGWRPAAGQRIELESRPNLRLPGRVMVSRA